MRGSSFLENLAARYAMQFLLILDHREFIPVGILQQESVVLNDPWSKGSYRSGGFPRRQTAYDFCFRGKNKM